MFGFANTGADMNLWNMDFQQSVAESHPKLVAKFAYLKYLDDIDPFNISGLDRGKDSEQVKGGVYVTVVITY